jgi:hypothetical protein
MIVSWTSLPLAELRLKELIVEGPRLAIRRDRSGVLRIAGLEFDPAQAADELPITDWILRQRQIVIRDALIVWDDDLRNAPQLVLDRVQFRLENRFGRHRFGLKGTPPADLAAPLDLRGDLELDSMKNWQNAQGTLFVRLDVAAIASRAVWQFAQRINHSLEIVVRRFNEQVHVLRGPHQAMQSAGACADDHVLDLMLLQKGTDLPERIAGQRSRGLVWLCRHFSRSSQVRNLKT